MNLSNFSNQDLVALKEGRYGEVSTEGLKQLRANYQNRIGETAFQNSIGSPVDSMSPGDRRLAGIGATFADVPLGIEQRFGKATAQDVDAKRATDAPLMGTKEGRQGALIGSVAKALPLSFMPGANSYVGAGLYGALQGAAEPTGSTDNVTSNALSASLMNAGGLGLGRMLFGGAARNTNNAVRQAQVDTAMAHNIPMTAGQQTGNQPLQWLESQVATLPGGGAVGDLMRRGRETYASRVMEQGGSQPGALATVAENQIARQNLRGNYQDIWSRNNVALDPQFATDINQVTREARRNLNDADFRVYVRNLQNLMQRNNNGIIPGDVYQRTIRQELDSVGGLPGDYVTRLRRALDGAATRSVSGPDAQALRDTNRTYAVNRTLEPVVNRAEGRGGVFAPDEVRAAIGSFAGEPGELARIGPLFRDLPNSGTANRQMVNNMLTTLGLAGLGGAGGYAAGGDTGGITGVLGGVLAPFAAASVLASPARNAISRGLIPIGPRAQNAFANTGVRPLLQGAPMAIPLLVGSEQ
jgi:hypothetical protein